VQLSMTKDRQLKRRLLMGGGRDAEPGSYKDGGQATGEAESDNSWGAHDDVSFLSLQLTKRKLSP
jgi:hypothetical protein